MERTYVFNQEPNGGGSKFDIMALLPNLMGGKGVDPGLLALLNQGRNNQDAWGGGMWWIWIILLWFCWGGNGFGGFGNRGGLPAELNGDVGREYLMSAIQGNGNAINQLASSLNCSTQQLQSALCNIQGLIQGVGNQVGMFAQQIINSIQSGNCTLATQIADCCCKTQNAIERQGYETRIATSEQTHSLVDSGNENTRAILAKLDSIQTQALQDKITALTAEKATLAAEISQRNQNATILNAVGQQIAPLAAGLQALQSDVEKVKCSLPPTISVPYPTVTAVNTDLYRAAAYGAYAGDVAYGRSGYGCGCNNYWG
ncbi:hypothetical protein [Barnesiella intestinihominis]|uniref:hypothetical protein n=1 Tax=Barnesiella intestinihominis TaxID=487174 RepID=UPI003AB13509